MPSILNATTTNGLVTSADNSGSLQLQTNNGTTAVTIDTSQNVGIGTASPTSRLGVSGAAQFIGTSPATFPTGNTGIEIVGGTNGQENYIQAYNRGASSWQNLQINSAQTGFGTGGSERMRITSGGTVIVNDTATGAFFDGRVSSFSATLPGVSAKTSGGAAMPAITSWNTATSGDNLFLQFATETTATARGSIDYNRGAGLTRYNTTSDATFKNIIGDSDGQKSVDILKSTKIREYAWKDDAEQKPQIGVIAQELYETYKGAVSIGGEIEKTDDEGNVTTEYKPWGVDKTAFTFHLIAGWQVHEKLIQEQQAMIEELKAEVQLLKNPPVEGTE